VASKRSVSKEKQEVSVLIEEMSRTILDILWICADFLIWFISRNMELCRGVGSMSLPYTQPYATHASMHHLLYFVSY
jgi:hypothetical protein